MSLEMSPEEYVDKTIDEVFQDTRLMTMKERMGIAAFELLEHIEAERAASNEVIRVWTEAGIEKPKNPRSKMFIVMAGHVGVAFGFPAVVDPIATTVDSVSSIPKPTAKEVAEKERLLDESREKIQNAKIHAAQIYELDFKSIQRVELKARSLKRPEKK